MLTDHSFADVCIVKICHSTWRICVGLEFPDRDFLKEASIWGGVDKIDGQLISYEVSNGRIDVVYGYLCGKYIIDC